MGRVRESVTMRDVAALASVSVKTVSNVINGYRYLRPDTKARVEAAIRTLGYRVNVTARNLRQGRTGLIKLVIPELRIPYFAELADSVVREAAERELTVLVEQHQYQRDLELRVLRGEGGQQVDGVLFSPVYVGQDDVDLFDVGFPMVILGESVFDAPCDHVSMRNVEAATAQVEHLAALGRTRIGVIGVNEMPILSSSVLRFRGVKLGLELAGLSLDPGLVAGPGPWVRPTGARLMGELLDRGHRLDAVVCFNDTLALGALHELIRRGIRVPDDVAVIGFDNVEETQFSQPTLSTIDPGRDRIAAESVRMLCERVGLVDDFDPATSPRELLVDYQVVPRQSTLGL
ncbi:MAG: LacI family transcriptional regulator [Propionibacteriaceae bacterium]|jgi:DNA-binding LacI/PurR family transcriptional regulator|nr:LacI family transcriptional regulator [Propionibacteriaceae bacterium]